MTKTKQTQKQTSSVTPTNPAWVTNTLQAQNDRVNKIGMGDPSRYVTGPTATQQAAFTGAAGLGGASNGLFDRASSLLTGDDYGNPYTQQVVNATLGEYDRNAGQLQAQQAAQAAKNNAFGGSRYALREAETASNLSRDRAGLQAGLLSDAYDKGVANRLQTAGLLGQLGQARGSEDRANIGAQLTAGGVERGINQEKATADITLAQVLAALQNQGQYGLFQGQDASGTSTATQTPSTLDTIGRIAQSGASLGSLFSDRRLKRDVVALGMRAGRMWYRFKYLWSDMVHEGVMAQENADIAHKHPSGYWMVDYSKLGVRHAA